MKAPEVAEKFVTLLQFPRHILAVVLLAIVLTATSFVSSAEVYARTASIQARKAAFLRTVFSTSKRKDKLAPIGALDEIRAGEHCARGML